MPNATSSRGPGASLPAIAELARSPQWVCWRFEVRAGAPEPTKVPVNAVTGRHASTTRSTSWHDFATAHAAAPDYDGFGFVVTGTPYCGVDLDHCLQPDGSLDAWAQAIVTALDSYTETTPSGASLRVWVRGHVPQGSVRNALGPDKLGRLEVYSGANPGRFFTVTENHYPGTPREIHDRQPQLDALFTQYWPDRVDGGRDVSLPTKSSADRGTIAAPLELPDDQLADLLARIRASGWRYAFDRLWDGDTTEWDGDDSRADLALCSMLAFWCQSDAARIDAVFRHSKLMRAKWDTRRGPTTYGARTIAKALESRRRPDMSYVHIQTGEPDSTGPTRTAENAVHARVLPARPLRVVEPSPTSEPTPGGLPLLTFKQFVATELRPRRWVVDGLLPAGGLSEIVAKAKVGKSTLARALVAAVRLGRDILGRTTTRGPVIYLCFEPSQAATVKAHLLALGVPADDEDLHVLVVPRAPADFFDALRVSVLALRPVLVVIDMLINVLTGVVDIADYVEMTRAMEPLAALAVEAETHLALLHHGRKAEGEDGDVSMGSTAIFGTVDTGIFLAKKGELRTLKSSQRDGLPFTEPVRWGLDATGHVTLAAADEVPVDEASVVAERIRHWLGHQAEPVTESAIRAHVRGRNEDLNMALRRLVHAHQVVRTGEGGRKDPYRYAIG